MPILANPKHEAFAQARAAGESRDEAYRLAGYKPSMQAASRLSRNVKVLSRIRELQAATVEAFAITAELIAARLDEDRRFAIECKQPSAAVAATIGLAKLGGLFVDKSVVQVTHNYAMMTEDELRYEIAALNAEARAIKPGIKH